MYLSLQMNMAQFAALCKLELAFYPLVTLTYMTEITEILNIRFNQVMRRYESYP